MFVRFNPVANPLEPRRAEWGAALPGAVKFNTPRDATLEHIQEMAVHELPPLQGDMIRCV